MRHSPIGVDAPSAPELSS